MYRKITTVTIEKEQIKYRIPGASQLSLLVEMIILGMKDDYISPRQQQMQNRDEIFQTCLGELAKLHQEGQSQTGVVKVINILTQITSGVETAKLFHQLISECFPDISEPSALTDEAKSQIFMILFNQIVENLQDSSKYISSISNS